MDMIQRLKKELIKFKLTHGTIVDIGAYDGVNVLATYNAMPGFTHYVIEPHPDVYKELCDRVEGIPNIKTYRQAITDVNGFLFLYSPLGRDRRGRVSQGSSMFEGWAERKARQEQQVISIAVKSQTLEDFCKLRKIIYINLLKINCEGSEFRIFKDRTSWSLLSAADIIYLQLHGKSEQFTSREYNAQKVDINWLLKEWGFKIVYGLDLSSGEIPTGHVGQIWSKA